MKFAPFFVLTVILLMGCSSGENTNDTINKDSFGTYYESNKMYQIDFPSDWQLVEKKKRYMVTAHYPKQQSKSYTPQIMVFRQMGKALFDTKTQEMTAQDFELHRYIESYKKGLPLKSDSVIFSDRLNEYNTDTDYWMEFEFYDRARKTSIMQMNRIATKGNIAYMIHAKASKEAYDSLKSMYEKSLRSLKIN